MTTQEYHDSIELYADKVYRFLLNLTADEEVAKDLVQDTFLKIWEKRKNIHFDTARSYLFTVARNGAMDHFREKKIKLSDNLPDYEDHSVNQPNPDLHDVLHEALSRLNPLYRSIVLLRDYEGYSYEEIAQISEISLEKVKVYLFRARRYLKNYLVNVEVVI